MGLGLKCLHRNTICQISAYQMMHIRGCQGLAGEAGYSLEVKCGGCTSTSIIYYGFNLYLSFMFSTTYILHSNCHINLYSYNGQ